MHQIRFRPWLCPSPCWEAYRAPPDLAGFRLPSCKVKEGRGGRKHPRFLPGLTPLPTSINCMRSKAQLELHVCEWNDDVTKWFLSLCVVLMLCQSDGWFVALSVFHADDICRCVKCSAALLHTLVQLVKSVWWHLSESCAVCYRYYTRGNEQKFICTKLQWRHDRECVCLTTDGLSFDDDWLQPSFACWTVRRVIVFQWLLPPHHLVSSRLALLLTAMLMILHMSFALYNETMATIFVWCNNFPLPVMLGSYSCH